MIVNSSIHMSSEYEQNVGTLLAEKIEKLEELEKNPDAKNVQKKILMSDPAISFRKLQFRNELFS